MAWVAVVAILCILPFSLSDVPRPMKIVIDTDIGQDFDDSWALALSLKSSESVSIELVLTAAHNTIGRAQIAAKYLDTLGRTDVPIGIGVKQDDFVGPLWGWANHYNLSEYPGKLYEDGVAQLAQILEASADPVYIMAIAPMVNFKALIDRFPKAAAKVAGIFAMSGSIHVCYHKTKGPCPEYNVKEDIPASKEAYAYPWKYFAATPLDTCGDVYIEGDAYKKLYDAAHNASVHNPLLKILIETYCYWAQHGGYGDCTVKTSTLYDATAAMMTIVGYPDFEKVDLEMSKLKVVVDDDGRVIIDPAKGQPVWEALNWKGQGLQKYEEWIGETILK